MRFPQPAAVPAARDAPPAPVREPRNWILRALPPSEYVRLRPHLETVEISALERLAEAEAPLPYAWFPETGSLSVVRCLRGGLAIEAATVGCEGMAGLEALIDDAWTPAALVGQLPGRCLRVPIERLRAALPALPTLRTLLHRCALAYVDQLEQAVACNAMHSVERRCARWLLAAHDRVDGHELHLTHEVLAQMLAVRRAGVTAAALALQQAGLIRYSRGHVTVLDRAGLEAAACECYGVLRAHQARLLALPTTPRDQRA